MDEISEFKSQLSYSDRKMWIAETIKHPAKIHLGMLEAIILEYTSENDIVLDPMCGTGSTLILAMLHNRNAIGIEYEEKFCKIIKANIELINSKQRITPLGHAEVIRGDARLLSSMFKDRADSVVLSPPYSESLTKRRKGHTHIDSLKKTRQMTDTQDDNIANLPHGDIAAILTSPPYADSISTAKPFSGWTEEAKRKWWETYKSSGGGMSYEKYVKYQTGKEYTYSDDKNNIGNLKNQTYLEAIKLVYSGCYDVLRENGIMVLITKNFFRSMKVVPLDQHTIKLCESIGFTFVKRHYRKITRPSFWRRRYTQKYGISITYEDILVFRK